MSATTSQPPHEGTPLASPPPARSGEACPVCGAPLHPEQSWCLSCGAAARTRLAPAPSWKRPIAAVAVVLVLALGVLAAALVDLAGGSAPLPATTTTVTTPAAPASTPTTLSTPTTAATSTSTTGSTAQGTTGATTTPGTGATAKTTSTPTTGATGTTTTTAPKSSSAPKLNSKTKNAITKGIEEALRKADAKKTLPGTGSTG